MKKLFLTAVVALFSLAASAQLMLVTTYDGDQVENMDKLTAHAGIGYIVSDAITVGAVRAKDANGDDAYEVFGRYTLPMIDGMYAALQAPLSDATDNMRIGVGMSFPVWNGLHIEPNYLMPVQADENDEREGKFNIGLSWRF